MDWRVPGLRRMRLPGVDASVNAETGSNAAASAARPDSGPFKKAGPIGGRTVGTIAGTLVAVMLLVAGPLLAAEEAAPDPADTATGTIFRWLNFLLVMGGIAYLIGKFGGPYFRSHAEGIAKSIRDAAEMRAASERELREVDERVASLNLEIQELRRVAVRESAAEAERLRELARVEAERIHNAARAEIVASERVARQELRAIAARLATERAAEITRGRMDPATDAALFRAFVGELERRAS
jgi:F-type H+-transporting ATPase subunit b